MEHREASTPSGENEAGLAEYLRQKIEHGVADYADRVRRLSKGYLAEVEKLARRTRDPAKARYFRDTMDLRIIAIRCAQIRKLARDGKLIEAHGAFENLRAELQSVEWLLQRRYLSAGLGKVQGAEDATARRQAVTEDRYDKIRNWFAALRVSGLSKGDAEDRTATQFSCGVRTVRTAVRGK